MTPAAIIAEIDRRQNQHLADMEPIKKRIALTDGEARRRANDLNAHVDAINTLEGIKEFIRKNTPAPPATIISDYTKQTPTQG